jgi:hypothetical protein
MNRQRRKDGKLHRTCSLKPATIRNELSASVLDRAENRRPFLVTLLVYEMPHGGLLPVYKKFTTCARLRGLQIPVAVNRRLVSGLLAWSLKRTKSAPSLGRFFNR